MKFCTLVLFLTVVFSGYSQQRELISAKAVDTHIKKGLDTNVFPGAQIVVGDRSGVLYSNSYGYQDYTKKAQVKNDDVYDLASCTKILSTTLAVMKLYDEGKLSLSTKLGDVVSRFSTTPIKGLAVEEMLKHTTGLKSVITVVFSLVHTTDKKPRFSSVKSSAYPYPYDRKLYVSKNLDYDSSYIIKEKEEGSRKISENLYIRSSFDQKIDSMIIDAYQPVKRGYYTYSDLNFFLLQQMVESVSGMSLDKYVEEIYASMGLTNIGYRPVRWTDRYKCVPTECDMLFRRDTVRGYVHDEFAAVLGGISGHAGLFSDAAAAAAVCQMFLNNGEYNGSQIITSQTVKLFTSSKDNFRGLGFDKQNPVTTSYSAESFGHSGFTGTFMWIDPVKNIYLVLLTNRVNPCRSNRLFSRDYRQSLWEIITGRLPD